MEATPGSNEACGPVGVFDSGIGGLTVAAAVRRQLGAEDVHYFGDTARVPYGGKSRETIQRYSVEISGLLLAAGAKAIVVACNTASALAMERLQSLFRAPILGVVEPGARAAVAATKCGRIGVIGTRATIRSCAYDRAIHQLNPDIEIIHTACPLLVPLIEEGLFEDAITELALARYLDPMLEQGIDTLVLGCTHYPLLKSAIRRHAPEVILVDSAQNLAAALREELTSHTLQHPDQARNGNLRVTLTDPADAFLRVAEERLQLSLGEVEVRPIL